MVPSLGEIRRHGADGRIITKLWVSGEFPFSKTEFLTKNPLLKLYANNTKTKIKTITLRPIIGYYPFGHSVNKLPFGHPV